MTKEEFENYLNTIASKWTVVEADDADAALEMAGDRGVSSLSGNVGDDETECWNFDNDGEPQGFSVVPWE